MIFSEMEKKMNILLHWYTFSISYSEIDHFFGNKWRNSEENKLSLMLTTLRFSLHIFVVVKSKLCVIYLFFALYIHIFTLLKLLYVDHGMGDNSEVNKGDKK